MFSRSQSLQHVHGDGGAFECQTVAVMLGCDPKRFQGVQNFPGRVSNCRDVPNLACNGVRVLAGGLSEGIHIGVSLLPKVNLGERTRHVSHEGVQQVARYGNHQ